MSSYYPFRFCQWTSVVSPCAEHSRSGASADTTPMLAEFAALWNEMRERYQEFQKVEKKKMSSSVSKAKCLSRAWGVGGEET